MKSRSNQRDVHSESTTPVRGHPNTLEGRLSWLDWRLRVGPARKQLAVPPVRLGQNCLVMLGSKATPAFLSNLLV